MRAERRYEAFLKRREKISREYIYGKSAPLRGITTTKNPATFFPPNGARVHGAKAANGSSFIGTPI